MADKKRSTMASVLGKITVFADSGEKIGQWGGTECFLSREPAKGPCLVVRSSKHKRGQGIFFQLDGGNLRSVLDPSLAEGKLTVKLRHALRVVNVMVATTDDIDALARIAGILRDRGLWSQMEVGVCAPNSKKRAREAPPLDRDLTLGNDPAPDAQTDEYQPETRPAEAASTTPRAPQEAEAQDGLSHSQRRALRLVEQGHHMFVTGAAGTGKTEWLRQLLARLPQGEATAVTAATGIAARTLGGSTVHSFAGIGIGEGTTEQIVARVRGRRDAMRALQRAAVWIIDEVSMIPADLLTLLDTVARTIRDQAYAPFGGCQMVLVGDFLQLPPVTRGGAEPAFCFSAPVWRELGLKTVEFTENYRQRSDPVFFQCLSDCRLGKYTPAVESVLGSCHRREFPADVVPTCLMPLLQQADAHNTARLRALESTEFHRFAADDSVQPGAAVDLGNDTPLVDHLELRPGARVVVTMNLPSGLRNGDVGEVVRFAEVSLGRVRSVPVVRFDGTDQEVPVHPATCEVSVRGTVLASRTQLPLRLGWALTVHKSQGMSLPYVEVALDDSFFEFGQAYVALSRARSAEGLRLTALKPNVVRAPKSALEFYVSVRRELDRLSALRGAR